VNLVKIVQLIGKWLKIRTFTTRQLCHCWFSTRCLVSVFSIAAEKLRSMLEVYKADCW